MRRPRFPPLIRSGPRTDTETGGPSAAAATRSSCSSSTVAGVSTGAVTVRTTCCPNAREHALRACDGRPRAVPVRNERFAPGRFEATTSRAPKVCREGAFEPTTRTSASTTAQATPSHASNKPTLSSPVAVSGSASERGSSATDGRKAARRASALLKATAASPRFARERVPVARYVLTPRVPGATQRQ